LSKEAFMGLIEIAPVISKGLAEDLSLKVACLLN
jgi:hypothetical protein